VNSATLIDSASVHAELDDPDLRILDATTILRRDVAGGPYVVESGRPGFDRAHIPGAQFADIPRTLSSPQSPYPFALPRAAEFAAAMRLLGVGTGTRVVAYSQGNPMWATRLWWLLRYFGFDDIAVLDGGLRAWVEAGYPVSGDLATYPPGEFVPAERTHLAATKDDVRRTLRGASACLLNALPPAAFRGEGPGAYGRRGRIPGSLSIPAVDLIDPDSGRFQPPPVLAAALEIALRTADGVPVIAYCGGGISATVDIFALALLGRDDAKLYDGSLTEWSADPSLPLDVG